jgi:biotin synthase
VSPTRKLRAMTRSEILGWLRQPDETRLEELWQRADEVRRQSVGDAVHLRGLLEISNHCVRRCYYCGLRGPNRELPRYRMTPDEILACAQEAKSYGYGTVVIQSGEDPGLTKEWGAELIRKLKADTDLAITLSLGERSRDELAAWRDAGADRYLLRFETSNRELYDRVHPSLPGKKSDRFAILGQLRELGYEVGSGVMVGIPGQTYDDLANDIVWFRELDLDMVGLGPYLPHPNTPLGRVGSPASTDGQVPNSELMTYKVLALTRLVCPLANIPSTTALATLNKVEGRELGLMRGANVVMPNVTPPQYRRQYEIYPDKACWQETAEGCHSYLKHRIESLGRYVGSGRGDSPNLRQRALPGISVGAETTK